MKTRLEHLTEQADEILRGFQAGAPRVLDRVRWNHPAFRRLTDDEIRARPFTLEDARLVIARLQHLGGWPDLLAHSRAVETPGSATALFETAADLVIAGDIAGLRALLREHPGLPGQRSARSHHSILLHYISANGVEDYRQITPPNIVAVTRFLLESGSDVNAESDAYGGGSTTLGLTATSAHPRLAGVQNELIDVLLDAGARAAPFAPGCLRDFLANGCPEAAAHLASRLATPHTLYGAAALGRVDLLPPLLSGSAPADRESALLIAAQCGHADAVAFLLGQGADPAASDGMTALHWAAANGDLPMIDTLLARGAPLEARNEYGGTVLSSTVWFACHALSADFPRRSYPALFDRLLAAGANADAYPALRADMEKIRERAASPPQERMPGGFDEIPKD